MSNSAPPTGWTAERLQSVLAAHRRFLDSGGAEGERADLRDAHLRGADLREARLERALLRGADLRDADLSGADLREVEGLLPERLGGANLAAAQLPPGMFPPEEMRHVEEMSRQTGKHLLPILIGCVYALLTIASTTDAGLITNSAMSELPIVGARVPIADFYLFVPILLSVAYLYFHLHLHRLWEALAGLPAVFPDGRPLDRKAYPWLFSGFVRVHSRRLRERATAEHAPLWLLHSLGSTLVAWCVVPATLAVFWVRYLHRHAFYGTAIHVVAFAATVAAGVAFHRMAVAAFRPRPAGKPRPGRWGGTRLRVAATGLAVLAAAAGISYGAVRGVPAGRRRLRPEDRALVGLDLRRVVPQTFAFLGYGPFADFVEADVSAKPEHWSGQGGAEIDLVKGARLRSRDLRYANAVSAFLVKADLAGANLEGANLQRADLRAADLRWANLDGADLRGAKLDGADLSRARLTDANLADATLGRARLIEAQLDGAILAGARFLDADLEGADLRRASTSGPPEGDRSWDDQAKTDLGGIAGLGGERRAAPPRGGPGLVELQGANLANADVSGADLSRAHLGDAQLASLRKDAATRLPTALHGEAAGPPVRPEAAGARPNARTAPPRPVTLPKPPTPPRLPPPPRATRH